MQNQFYPHFNLILCHFGLKYSANSDVMNKKTFLQENKSCWQSAYSINLQTFSMQRYYKGIFIIKLHSCSFEKLFRMTYLQNTSVLENQRFLDIANDFGPIFNFFNPLKMSESQKRYRNGKCAKNELNNNVPQSLEN